MSSSCARLLPQGPQRPAFSDLSAHTRPPEASWPALRPRPARLSRLGAAACRVDRAPPAAAARPNNSAMAADGLTQIEIERLQRMERNARRMAETVGSMDQYALLQ